MSGYFDTVRDEIEPLLPVNPAVIMDIGCGTGATSRWLKQICPNATTIGVELDGSVAALAATAVDRVLVADLDRGLEVLADYEGRVELLLLLDVLEHLHDPWTRLSELKRMLAPGGVVIASIPNVRNLKVLGPLLFKGEWQYRSSGILDRTHLRFFTRRTVEELFSNTGYDIQKIAPTGPLQRSRIKSLAGGAVYAVNLMLAGTLENFFANQYLVRAVVSPGSSAARTN